MPRSNRTLVPQARAGLNQLKAEAAQSLGVQTPADGYYGFVTARETGALGGYMVKNMIASVEQSLSQGAGGLAGFAGQTGGSR
ncbi:alpha/beta-type small acid-soluble spore protein [Cohnella pontilimi]|uniref:Alpha/beta-type small acid-soluble spore protein n=1 Tax=Cohnella pontilimi TaxID=2564100 RepID=A0A4U0F5W2_9BACL|nr:alpha/beta-type small acid-soluble spore protein [Cohnella pontilimi]TJY39820.1 alpha/beta-type small acid-soluble spore protein [Cohnella pontilimi]